MQGWVTPWEVGHSGGEELQSSDSAGMDRLGQWGIEKWDATVRRTPGLRVVRLG